MNNLEMISILTNALPFTCASGGKLLLCPDIGGRVFVDVGRIPLVRSLPALWLRMHLPGSDSQGETSCSLLIRLL